MADAEYAQFKCPYLCGVPVELPSANVRTKKATKCYEHMVKCSGVTEDGRKAQDDPRVNKERCAKRMRQSPDQVEKDDVVALLKQEIVAKNSELSTLKAEEEHLISRNETLVTRVHSLEERERERCGRDQAHERRFREMDESMTRMRIQLEQLFSWQGAVVHALKISTPPAPAAHLCVDRIQGLQRAAAVASVTSKTNKRNQDSTMQDKVEEIRKECNDIVLRAYGKRNDGLLADVAKAIRRDMLLLVHPDKVTGEAKPWATLVSQRLGELANTIPKV